MTQAKELTSGFPPMISFILTGKCNMRCIHCYPESGPEYDEPEMDHAGHVAAIKQFAMAGVRNVFLSGGEALMVGQIFDLIELIHTCGMTCWVCTNGSPITENTANRLSELGVLGVSVSLDGADSSIHDSFRVFEGALSKACTAIKRLRMQGIQVFVDYTATLYNAGEAEDVVALASELDVQAVYIKRFRPVGRGAADHLKLGLELEDYRGLTQRMVAAGKKHGISVRTEDPALVEHWRTFEMMDEEIPSLQTSIGCFAGIGWLGVMPNGDITPCPLLPMPIGNVLKDDLCTCYDESEIIAALKDRNFRGGACGNCNRRSVCGGCRAHALAETGNALAADPYCAYQNVSAKTIHID